jgi:hypothetical protein
MPATIYSNALAERILAEISDGVSLTKACAKIGADRRTVQRWVLRDLHGFADRYKTARLLGCDVWAEDVLDLSDESAAAAGDMALMGSYKLRVDSRKWLLGKLRPELYGDRVQHRLSGEGTIRICIPDNQRALPGDDARVIDGTAQELIEDDST